MIDVPPESQVYRQVVRKEADARAIAVDPVVRLYTVEVEEPELGSSRSDAARLLDALAREWGLHDLQFGYASLAKTPTCSENTRHDGARALARDGGGARRGRW